jgi:hypothetical protein
MDRFNQIRIIQDGSELFAFDTIRWPGEVFQYPIVYMAEAMNEGSYESQKIGWKWIKRDQFEWLLKHASCMVSYIGVSEPGTFYCNNHLCWEKAGKDWSCLDQQIEEPSFYADPELDEERKV